MIKWTREEVGELLDGLDCVDYEEYERIASHLNAYGVTTPTLIARLDRFESKLDTLINALASEDDKPMFTLDGDPLPQDRAEGVEL